MPDERQVTDQHFQIRRVVREGDLNQAQPTLVMPDSAGLSVK
jgi:hypothetical protein